MGKKEEITDVISAEGYAKIKRGDILRFSKATLKITRKAMGRVWAEHVSDPTDMNTAMTHYGHIIDNTQPGPAWCEDCEEFVDRPASEEGEVKAALRRAPNREARRKIERAAEKRAEHKERNDEA